jgi:hypothetical protein
MAASAPADAADNKRPNHVPVGHMARLPRRSFLMPDIYLILASL